MIGNRIYNNYYKKPKYLFKTMKMYVCMCGYMYVCDILI